MPWFDEERAQQLLDAAVALGATMLDTGPTYSDGQAERRLGRALNRLEANVVISTKVGSHLDARGRIYKDYSQRAIVNSLSSSLKTLGRDSVDIAFVHGPLDVSDVCSDLYATLEILKSRGMAEFVGASCDGPVAERIVTDGVLDVLMTTFNDLNGDPHTVNTAMRSGLHVVAKSPMGSVAVRFPKRPLLRRESAWYNARMLVRRPNDVAHVLRERLTRTASGAVGLPFVLAQRAISTAMLGTTSIEHLTDNVHQARLVRS